MAFLGSSKERGAGRIWLDIWAHDIGLRWGTQVLLDSLHTHWHCHWYLLFITPPRLGQQSIVMSVSVCLSDCDHVFGTTCLIFTKCSVHFTYGRGSVLLWRHSDTLCTSGFMDNSIFAHNNKEECRGPLQIEKGDKGSMLTRMGVSGWMFLLVPAYPGCPGQTAVKWLLLLLSIFARNPRLLDVAAQLKRSAHAALGLAVNCAQ